MIAHRLQTIKTANNLLYLENPKSVLAGKKGTDEYDKIMDRLVRTNYAHQADEPEADQESIESEESDEEVNQSAHSKGSHSMSKEARRASKAIQKDIKRASQLTPAAKVAMDAQKSEQGKIKVATKFVSSNAGWGRLMEYYKPKIAIFFMVVLALINSCSMPFIAYCIIQL